MSCATRHCFSVVRSEINASEGGKLSKCVKSGKYSVIPAKARIHRPTTSMPEKDTPSFPKTLRHSREGGNPQFPRMREFNDPLPQRPRKTLRHSPKHSVIPAKAGIHNSRACGNSTSHYPDAREKHSIIPKNTPSFPRRRE